MTHLLLSIACTLALAGNQPDVDRAQQTLDSIYRHYGTPGTCLLHEQYPADEAYKATYLASESQAEKPNEYSYLWPYSGTFSATSALLEATGSPAYKKQLDERVLPGLEAYFDTRRTPAAYSSYIAKAPLSDRFYDDNIWLGIDFADCYRLTKRKSYLEKAKLIWTFVRSGEDEVLGGGIYWCEQKKKSKNTCSNAPAAVLALKLYQATHDPAYLQQGKALYAWTQQHLEDPADHLYFDNINLEQHIGRAKYAYNSGQMMQAAALLYRLTKEETYLQQAQTLAKACYQYFLQPFTNADDAKTSFRLPRKGNIWFTAVMLRGFIELYRLDGNKEYLLDFQRSLDYAWLHARDAQGLFDADWGDQPGHDPQKWLLTQAAFVEMYARMAAARL
ncbi:MAG: glycoside hydrolase family 76 protein [Mediterranea sp.]|jgi:uncharacterized protein YyaL (SSP411 family)|nr:glycoside hydrolase family 76 protein [Mediterranea sp.]